MPPGREIQSGKLVRDNMPDIIRSHGDEPVIRIASEHEFRLLLREKLVEEALEVRDATSEAGTLEELADVLECVKAIAGILGLTMGAVEHARLAKARERGGFTRGFIWYDDGSERSAPGWTP
jgi:predicted house-cleaning noncanonical NTP pyrophosphatase (MazG superfamily)